MDVGLFYLIDGGGGGGGQILKPLIGLETRIGCRNLPKISLES